MLRRVFYPNASSSKAGPIEIATQAEVNAEAAINLAVVPSTLAAYLTQRFIYPKEIVVATRTLGDEFPANQSTAVVFNSPTKNEGSILNTSNGEITIAQLGFYSIIATIRKISASSAPRWVISPLIDTGSGFTNTYYSGGASENDISTSIIKAAVHRELAATTKVKFNLFPSTNPITLYTTIDATSLQVIRWR